MALFELPHLGLGPAIRPDRPVQAERSGRTVEIIELERLAVCGFIVQILVHPIPDEPALQALVPEQVVEIVPQYGVIARLVPTDFVAQQRCFVNGDPFYGRIQEAAAIVVADVYSAVGRFKLVEIVLCDADFFTIHIESEPVVRTDTRQCVRPCIVAWSGDRLATDSEFECPVSGDRERVPLARDDRCGRASVQFADCRFDGELLTRTQPVGPNFDVVGAAVKRECAAVRPRNDRRRSDEHAVTVTFIVSIVSLAPITHPTDGGLDVVVPHPVDQPEAVAHRVIVLAHDDGSFAVAGRSVPARTITESDAVADVRTLSEG